MKTASEILNTTYPDTQWIVEDILPVGLTLLAAPPKAGKSWMAMQIAGCCGFLDKEFEIHNVLYFALEDSPARIKSRMMAQGWLSLAGEWVNLVSMGDDFVKLDDEAGMIRLESMITNLEVNLVIIDTLGEAYAGGQGSYASSTHGLRPLQALAHKHNCAILAIDHHVKASSDDVIRDIQGSIGKAGVVDTVWGLYVDKKGQVWLKVKGRDVENQEIPVEFHDDCMWHITENIIQEGDEFGSPVLKNVKQYAVKVSGNVLSFVNLTLPVRKKADLGISYVVSEHNWLGQQRTVFYGGYVPMAEMIKWARREGYVKKTKGV